MLEPLGMAIYAVTIFQLIYRMILLIAKLPSSSVTFVPLFPLKQGNTHYQFFHCKLQLTHFVTLFWKRSFYLEQNFI